MREQVLVIDDESILAEAISLYLDHHGYATAAAESGEDGLRLAERMTPDVAIVDVRLPGIDGFEVLRRMRDVSPNTKVIMTTAHASISSSDVARSGGFAYLCKPFDLDKLREVVETATCRRVTRLQRAEQA